MRGQEAAPSAAEQAERKKAQGNASFKKRKYKQAAAAYGEAIALQPTNHVLYANRCATRSHPQNPPRMTRKHLRYMPGFVARFRAEVALAAEVALPAARSDPQTLLT